MFLAKCIWPRLTCSSISYNLKLEIWIFGSGWIERDWRQRLSFLILQESLLFHKLWRQGCREIGKTGKHGLIKTWWGQGKSRTRVLLKIDGSNWWMTGCFFSHKFDLGQVRWFSDWTGQSGSNFITMISYLGWVQLFHLLSSFDFYN